MLNPQGISNVLNALNSMQLSFFNNIKKDVRNCLLDSIDRNAVHFNPQDIANTLLAVNQMGVKWVDIDKNLQDKLLSSVDRNAVQFNSIGISSTLLSFDGMGLEIEDLKNTRNTLLDAIARLSSTFTSRHIL